MFDLGKNLSDLIRRILTGTTINKRVVEEILCDLKKILLQSDIDVKLTDNLVSKIREKCLEEKIPAGLTLREHVLKVIYEELVKLLGKEPSSLVEKKRIMFVGLFGSGKCIHKDSFVPLANGEILKIRELYERYRKIEDEKEVKDGYKIDIKKSKLEVFSFDPKSLKIEKREVSTLWKLRPKEKLIKINLDNGKMHEIIVTPEHPFYVMGNGTIKETRAEDLKEGYKIAVPNCLPFENKKLIDMKSEMLNKLSGNFAILSKEVGEKIKEALLETHGTLKKAYNFLNPPFSYSRFTYILKHGIIPFNILRKVKPELIYKVKEVKIKYYSYPGGSKKYIKIPSSLNSKLAQFLGYILSEGNLEKNSVHVTNANDGLLKRVKRLAHALFGLETSLTQDKRRPNIKKVNISSKTLVMLLKDLFGVKSGGKSSCLTIPKLILISPNKILNGFIRAYFDGEGSIKERYIEISSASKEMIWQIGLALLRSNILSSYSMRKIDGKIYYRLFIRGIYAEDFGNKISSNILEKRIALAKARIGKHQSPEKLEAIPTGPLLSCIHEVFGISIGEMQNYVSPYGIIEREGYITRTSLSKYLNATLGRLLQLGWIIESNRAFSITEKGKKKLEETSNLEFLSSLSNSDVSWVKIKKITKIESDSEYVYDLTVDDLHNFVANGIIVHNTTSTAKIARYFQKKGLRPALICLDYHRPAAPEQLKQLAEKINAAYYIEESKNPYEAAKKALEKFKKYDVLIFDTAGRNALDKELADELKKLAEIIKPDEVLLTIPAEIGKVAKRQSEEFNKLVGITGIFVTRLDGTAKGGGALSSCAATGAKVKFIGTGEKIEDLEAYDPRRFISRLLGLGDLQTLLEKAKEAEVKPEKVEKIIEGKFTLEDFYEQIKAMQKMGPLKQIASLIPGFGMMKVPEELLEIQEEKMKAFRYIIDSMTKEEKRNPEIINESRIKRIAKGSGRKESEVRELLQQYNKMKKLLKMIGGKTGLERGAFQKIFRKFGFKF